jgi:hypothetical protein
MEFNRKSTLTGKLDEHGRRRNNIWTCDVAIVVIAPPTPTKTTPTSLIPLTKLSYTMPLITQQDFEAKQLQ